MRGPDVMPFKSTPQAELHVHVFGPDDAGVSNRYPAIVFFFCGGWRQFNPTKFYPHCEYLAMRGMVCVNAEVRVKQHGTTPAESVSDARSAIRWTRRNAATLGVDPARTATGGGSAAGAVAACLGTIAGFDDPEDDLSVSAIPDAFIMFNPVLDMTSSERRIRLSTGIAQARSLSPLYHVRAHQPPALVMHPRDDARVPVRQSIDFARAMREAGNRCDLELWEEGGHGWFNYRDGNNPWFFETTECMDRFLSSLGWLAGEPTIRGFEFHYVPDDVNPVIVSDR